MRLMFQTWRKAGMEAKEHNDGGDGDEEDDGVDAGSTD